MEKPLISVIVPVFNLQGFIGRCIESVEIQTFRDWELIIINDGSSDNSLEICQKYAIKDDRIRVFSQNNAGVSTARNLGLNEARGEYIAFIDGDDYWIDSHYLDVVKQVIPADVIYNPNLILQYPNGSKREDNCSRSFPEKTIRDNPARYLAHNLSNQRWGCVFFIIKKSIIDQNNTRFIGNYKIGEDADWVFRSIANANNMVIIDNVNYVYCVNRPGSAMTKKNPDAVKSFFEMTKSWKSIAEKNSLFLPVYVMFCNNAMGFFIYL